MKNLNVETGCLYDTVAFFSRYFDETENHKTDGTIYHKIKDNLKQAGTVIPKCLIPFAYRYNIYSFLLSELLLNGTYSDWSYDRMITVLKNKQYVRMRFCEYFFDSSDQTQTFKKLTEHPSGIEMIRQRGFDSSAEVYIYYLLLHFDEVIQSLTETIHAIYKTVKTEHDIFISQSSGFISSLKNEANIEKFNILAKTKNESLKFSLTLMDEDRIEAKDSDPCFFLLGIKYETVLDTRYKYINADPYSFSQAIGNSARYDIYRALLSKASMTRFEMERTLHLSRAALDHNLKIMRDTGLLVVDHQEGITNHYKLDFVYIKTVANNILEGVF